MNKTKHIVITGAASGIGKSLAEKYLNSGNKVTVIDINQQGLENFKTENQTHIDRINTISCDLSDETQIDQITKEIDRPIDILVNNAGYVSGKSFLDLTKSDIKKTFEINVYAPFFMTQAILPSMLKRNSGQIVNIASASSLVGVPKLSDYAASKAAILSMDESLRLELKKMNSNVTTTAILPFYINTGMFDGVKTRFSFLLPILDPTYVTNKMYKAINNKEKRLIMPWFVYTIFPLKALSVKIADSLLSFFGVNSSMDDFLGRKN